MLSSWTHRLIWCWPTRRRSMPSLSARIDSNSLAILLPAMPGACKSQSWSARACGICWAGDQIGRRAGVYLLEDYDPNKRPLVMIHGLGSTPLIWAQLVQCSMGRRGPPRSISDLASGLPDRCTIAVGALTTAGLPGRCLACARPGRRRPGALRCSTGRSQSGCSDCATAVCRKRRCAMERGLSRAAPIARCQHAKIGR